MQRSTKLTVKEKSKLCKFRFSNLKSFQVNKFYGPKRYELYLKVEFTGGKWEVFGVNDSVKVNGWKFEFEEFVLDEVGIGYEFISSWSDFNGSLTGLDSTINSLFNGLSVA